MRSSSTTCSSVTNFNPEVGFLRRDDFRRTFATAQYSPRPRSIRAVRQFTVGGSLDYIENGAGQVETRIAQLRFNTEFENSYQFGIDVQDNDELLARPFRIASDVTIQTGAYAFQDVFASYSVGPTRRFSGTFSTQRGEFFSSSTDSLSANLRLRWEYQPGSELFVYNDQRDTSLRGTPLRLHREVHPAVSVLTEPRTSKHHCATGS